MTIKLLRGLISASKIKEFAREAGFDLCGVARVRSLDDQSARLSEWLGKGYDSGLAYMGRNIDKRLDPALLYDGAKSVIVCAANYKNEFWDQHLSYNPKISSYALSQDYHMTMKAKMNAILKRLTEEHPSLHGRCFTDSAPVLEKSWAIEAGLGWRGKNSLVVTPSHGSFVFLGEIIVDAEADAYDEPSTDNRCGTCTACIDACPNSAIIKPYVIDTNRCISRLTTEKPAGIKASSESAVFTENTATKNGLLAQGAALTADTHNTARTEGMEGMADTHNTAYTTEMTSTANTHNTHGWIFGCDVCQSVCPHNSRTPLFSDSAFKPFFSPTAAGENLWSRLNKEEFEKVFGTTPIARTGFQTIKERAARFFKNKEQELER